MKNVKLTDLILVPALNITRNGEAFTSMKDRETLAGSFFRDGWIGSEKSAIVTPVECLPDSYISDGLLYRDALPSYVEGYEGKVADSEDSQQNIKFDADAYAQMAAKMFGNKQPKYVVVDANRRIESLILANMYRQARGEELILSVPCDVQSVSGLAEFYLINSRANMHTIGKREVGPVNLLRTAKGIHDNMGNQNQVRKAMPAGTGQKMWSICVIDKAMPDLGFYAKCIDDSAYLVSVNKTNAVKLQSKITKLNNKGQDLSDELKQEIVSFINTPKGEAAPKMMPRTEVAGMKQSPVDLVAEVATAVLNNDKDSVLSFAQHADLLNMVTSGKLTFKDDVFTLETDDGVKEYKLS